MAYQYTQANTSRYTALVRSNCGCRSDNYLLPASVSIIDNWVGRDTQIGAEPSPRIFVRRAICCTSLPLINEKMLAITLENQLKAWNRSWKIEIIESHDLTLRDRFDHL